MTDVSLITRYACAFCLRKAYILMTLMEIIIKVAVTFVCLTILASIVLAIEPENPMSKEGNKTMQDKVANTEDVKEQQEKLKFEQEKLDFKQEKDRENWINRYLFPSVPHLVTILVAVIVGFIGFKQLQTQHLNSLSLLKQQNEIDGKAKIDHELWQVKYEAYQEALDFVARYYYSLEWNYEGKTHRFSSETPKSEDYGRIYGRLRLLTDNPKLVQAFLACLGVEGREDGKVTKLDPKPEYVDNLVKIMRDDLGAKKDPTPSKDFALIDFLPKQPEKK